ncbi:MAG TPA: DUF2127 domain-containing protein [Rhizomicrobium sp.]|nr:DUF2127 domain-containing protein [Rhizomicrobium sp.]
MTAAGKSSPIHLAYLATLLVKGFDGAVEILAGLVIFLTGPARIYRWVVRVTAPEIYDGSHAAAVHAIRTGAEHLATTGAHFVEFYLVAHGLLKLALVLVLLRGGGRWIFPVGVVILGGFIGYMSWRLNQQWSDWLLGFALFDVLTLALVLNEWRRSPTMA